MKILCGKKVNLNNWVCFSHKKNNIQPYIIRLDITEEQDKYKLYKVECNFQTRKGFIIPDNVCVLKCPLHTFGLIGFNETAILIPIIEKPSDCNISNIMDYKYIFLGVPSNILIEYHE